ncbi:hypothetical protein ACLOJK_039380 [Asimina triloba]
MVEALEQEVVSVEVVAEAVVEAVAEAVVEVEELVVDMVEDLCYDPNLGLLTILFEVTNQDLLCFDEFTNS